MKYLSITLLFTIFTFHFTSFGQSETKKKSSVEVIDFGRSEKPKKERTTAPMIIKSSPTSPIFGKGIFELEREVTDYLSLQVGLGVTFKSLYNGGSLSNILSDEEVPSYCESEQWPYDVCDDYLDYTNRKGKLGILLSISPRFYFESDGFEGNYLAPVLRYSRYNYEAQGLVASTEFIVDPDNFTKEKVNYLDFVVHFGHQVLYPKMTWEYFLGVGARKENSTRQDLGLDGQGIYRVGTTSINKTSLLLEAGMRFGFQL